MADVTGLSALSDDCSAVELVRMLNELFGRFDQLAAVRCVTRYTINHSMPGRPKPQPAAAVRPPACLVTPSQRLCVHVHRRHMSPLAYACLAVAQR